jgi:hypothetical protein
MAMKCLRGVAMAAVLLVAACGSMREQGWLRLRGAMVESDGRQIKNCRLDVFDAADDKRMVGQDVDGKFDLQMMPRRKQAKSYYFIASCRAFKEDVKLGPYDTDSEQWTYPLDLGDIVFRRIPG